MLAWPGAVTYVNARVMTPWGEARSIRVRRRILTLDNPPKPGDHVVDLDGRFVLPGLINAHDHLELNHYGPLRPRERYGNAREWIADLAPMVKGNPTIVEKSRIALSDRLFVGGLKNLLAGVTTSRASQPAVSRAWRSTSRCTLSNDSAGRIHSAWSMDLRVRTASRAA
ncbi:MAG: hypothetical protein QM736_04490 [Vicinamibacterales bacterium]